MVCLHMRNVISEKEVVESLSANLLLQLYLIAKGFRPFQAD